MMLMENSYSEMLDILSLTNALTGSFSSTKNLIFFHVLRENELSETLLIKNFNLSNVLQLFLLNSHLT